MRLLSHQHFRPQGRRPCSQVPAASAATEHCGIYCVTLASQAYGTGNVVAVTSSGGTLLAPGYNSKEDFIPVAVGTVASISTITPAAKATGRGVSGRRSAATEPKATSPAWSEMPAEDVVRELQDGLRAILARELHMPEAKLELDRPFAELGMNSVMAMSVRRDTEQFVGIELSATMLFNYPTIVALAGHLTKKLLPQTESDSDIDTLADSDGSVLSELFDSVESAPAGSERGV